NLGEAQLGLGRFPDALASFERAAKLAAPFSQDALAAARLLPVARRWIELDRKLPEVLAGKAKPASDAERLALASLAGQPYKGLHAQSAALYLAAFESSPGLADPTKGHHRYNAACAAVLAAASQGKGAPEADRARWRRQALAWLNADLEVRAR